MIRNRENVLGPMAYRWLRRMISTCPPLAGKAANGKDTKSLCRIRIVYVESGFKCISLVGPGQGLQSAVKLAMDHGLAEAAKKLGLAKQNIRALLSAPLIKNDGSVLSAQEWASTNFIVVEMKSGKEEEGLLGKYRKQLNYMEKLIKENMIVKDLTATSSNKNVNNAEDLTSEGFDMRKLGIKISSLEIENSNLKTKLSSLEIENSDLKIDVSNLGTKFSSLIAENANLKLEVSIFRKQVGSLEDKVNIVTKQLSELSAMEKVMIRKMLDRCRQKTIGILLEHRMLILNEDWQLPEDWQKVLSDARCIQVLRNEGLDSGLLIMRFDKRSYQKKGNFGAPNITESPDIYATIVCKMTGETRARMLNVFRFVFGSDAEDLTCDDEY